MKGFNFEKDLIVKHSRSGNKTSIGIGLKGIRTWGNYSYHDALTKPTTYNRISPYLGFNYEKNNITFMLQGYVMRMNQNRKQPIYINMAFGYPINLSKPRIKPKQMEW